MFGYLTPLTDELRIREYKAYRGVYCGLCKELGRRYGQASRLLLNYDLVLIALAADGLAGTAPHFAPERCIAAPFARHPVCGPTPGLALAADALLLLSWYKLRDDLADEGAPRRVFSRTACLTLKGAYGEAARRRPALDALFCRCMEHQAALEAAGCALPDEAASPSAELLGGLFAECAAEEDQRPVLERYGLFLGRIIYFLDAAEDFERDAAQGRYNVFLQAGVCREEMLRQARALCNMCAGEATMCYHLLPLKENRPLLDNVMYLGLPQSILRIGESQKDKRRNRHERPL